MNQYSVLDTYNYQDESGSLLYRIVRKGGKQFFAQSPDGNGGFVAGIDGIRRVPYRLPELLEAIENGGHIFIVEGEKDSNALWNLELPATTNVFGAGKWLDEYNDSLKGAAGIVVLPDNDEPGRKHMAEVASSLMRASIKVKLLELPGLEPKSDVSDWLANGGTKERLLELVEGANYLPGDVTPVTDVTDSESPTESESPKGKSVTPVLRSNPKSVTVGTTDYEIDDDGVWYCPSPDSKGNVKAKEWICSPLIIERDTRDNQGQSWGRLMSFKDREGLEHRLALPMEEFKGSGESARGELLHNGLRIAQTRSARERLSDYIQNAPTIGYARCVAASGWHDNSFVLPDGTVLGESVDNSGEIIILQSTTAVQHGVAAKGTLQGWKDKQGKWCKGNSRLIGAVNGSFAAPLLNLLDQEPGGINFKGDSSIGKTAAARVAASVYGSKEYLKTWRATANGIEGVAAAHNDLPLILDEAAQADPKEISSVCYMIGNGKQKSRANKWGAGRATNDFRNFAISTSEKPLAAYMAGAGLRASAGMEVRIVEIPANMGKLGIFEELHGLPDGAAFAGALREACNENYGVVGIEYLKRVCQARAQLLQRFREFHSEFLKENLPDNAAEQVKRVCGRFALKAFAGELATSFELTGWDEGEAIEAEATLFKAWLEHRGGSGQKERAEVIDCVRLFFEQNGSSRFEDWDDREKTVYNRAGFYKADNNCYYVLPNVLRHEVLKAHDFSRAKEYLHEEGMLISTDPSTVRPSLLEPVRCYCFKNVLSGSGELDAST